MDRDELEGCRILRLAQPILAYQGDEEEDE